MSLGFFQNQTGNPAAEFLRRMAVQTDAGIPATSGWVDFYSNGGPFAITPTVIPRGIIGRSGERQAPMLGPIEIGNTPMDMGDLNVGKEQLLAIAAYHRKYTATTPTAGVYRYVISSAGATDAETLLSILTHSGTGKPFRLTDCMPAGYSLAAQPSQNLRLIVNMLATRADFYGFATQTEGTGSTLPIFRGQVAAWSASDKDVVILVVDDTPLSVKSKIAAATTFDGAAISGTAGEWILLNDGTAVSMPLGGWADQGSIYWPASPTLAANDEFLIPATIPLWTPSFATVQPLPVINTRVLINGSVVNTEGWTITANKPGAVVLRGTNKQGYAVLDRGESQISVQIQRRLVDLDLQNALLHGTPVQMVQECRGGQIGSTSYYYRQVALFPKLIAEGALFDTPAGGQDDQENLTLQAYESSTNLSYEGNNYTKPVTWLIDTDVASIAS
jgi:hypothetical protein